jgi:hypothetical protein
MNIKYGMILRLRHQRTGRLLKSWDKRYPPPSISNQQVVAATNDESDSGTLWRVKGPDGTHDDADKGKTVKHGAVIRFEHLNTRTNLHSHPIEEGHLAFFTRDRAHQEVTCAGSLGNADNNDNWRVEVEGGGCWVANAVVRLVHVNTNRPLHSHGNSVPALDGLQEITAFLSRDENDHFLALPVQPPKPAVLAKLSRRNGSESVRRLLRQFSDCVGYALSRRKKPVLKLEVEAGVQDLLFFMLKASIPDLTAESPVAGLLRQFSVVDFKSRSLRLVIETKMPRDRGHAKRLRAELNDDIHKYRDDPHWKDLFFVIYDPKRFIEAPAALIKTVNGTHTKGNRSVRVHCLIEH